MSFIELFAGRVRRLWLIFAQAVTVILAILFVVATLRPEWVRSNNLGSGAVSAPAGQAAAFAPGANGPVSYAAAVARAAPAVVNVYTAKIVNVPFSPPVADPVLSRFFERMPGALRRQAKTSLGSGVIVHSGGMVLTNFHVIEAADAIEIALADGRTASAVVVGADPETDLAVLKFAEKMPDLPTAAVPDDQPLSVGDVVLAIGNPFGVGQTTTQGIVSALGRNRLGINTYENFIQTDAAINPGNSGGALINAQGLLVGINTAIYSPSGGSLGIGFAIPIEAAMKIMDEIVRTGSVKRGWLGVEPQDITPDLARSFNLKDRRGVVIASVMRDGPASHAGLRVGDLIRAVEGVPVDDTASILSMIAALPPGHEAVLSILRNGGLRDVNVVVGTRPGKAG